MPKGVEKAKDPVRKKPRLTLVEKRRARRQRRAEQTPAHRGTGR